MSNSVEQQFADLSLEDQDQIFEQEDHQDEWVPTYKKNAYSNAIIPFIWLSVLYFTQSR